MPTMDPGLLLPCPQHIQLLDGFWCPPPTIGICAPGLSEGTPAGSWLQRSLARFGTRISWAQGPEPSPLRVSHGEDLGTEAYELSIGEAGVHLRSGGSAGTQYGLATLCQCLDLCGGEDSPRGVQGLRIEDAPAFAERGVLLDVARGKRPKLEQLKELIDRLARWKFNRVQLYMEADFAFPDAEEVLKDRSPYKPEEIEDLASFARDRHVQLIPNQQSFGHLHAWLRHPRWRSLAEVPEGVEHPFSKQREPFSLDVSQPDSLRFVEGLYDQMLPSFGADTLNVGLDETFDLGLGGSKRRCEELGKPRVYLEYLQQVHESLARRGVRMQYWGDIVLQHPEIIGELPADATAMVWGYEPDFPFEEQLPHFAASGLPFQVCPGTSSWNSFGGRVTSALGNLRKAGLCAQEAGAQGLLVTDWGDRGHLQPWCVSEFGWALGAACAWNPVAAGAVELDGVRRWLDLWAFEDTAKILGAALIALGSTSEVLGDQCENGNALFFNWVFAREPFPDKRLGSVAGFALEEAGQLLEDALADLHLSNCARPDASDLRAELEFARDALLLSNDLLRERLTGPPDRSLAALPLEVRKRLLGKQAALMENHRACWNRRFRPGGLAASLVWLEMLEEA